MHVGLMIIFILFWGCSLSLSFSINRYLIIINIIIWIEFGWMSMIFPMNEMHQAKYEQTKKKNVEENEWKTN